MAANKPPPGGDGYYTHIRTVSSFQTSPNNRANFATIDIPCLILKGQYDNQAWGYTAEYTRLLKNAWLKVIPEAGYRIYKEQPEMFIQLIKSFL